MNKETQIQSKEDQNTTLFQTNFYAYYLHLFNFYNEKIITNWWEKDFCDNLQEAYYDYIGGVRPIYCFEAPVQHGKSEKLRYFLSWIVGRHPDKRFNFYSGDDSLRRETSIALKDILKSSEYVKIFGNRVKSDVVEKGKKAVDNIDAVDLKGRDKVDGKVNLRILSGGAVGYPSHFSICDDPYAKQEQASSEVQNAKVLTNYRTGIISRRQKDNMIIIVHSRWNPNDLIGQYRRKQKANRDSDTKIFSYPAIAIEDEKHRKKGEALFPEFRDLGFLNSQRDELSTNEFLALYQQNPRVSEEVFFKEGDLRYYTELPQMDRIVQSWDTAASDKKHSAFSVCATIGIKKTQFQDDYYLINIWRKKALYPALKQAFLDLMDQYSPHEIIIEEKSSGVQIKQELEAAGNKRIKGVKPNTDKIARAAVPSEIIAQGRWYLPKEAPWLDEYLDELLEFPDGPYMDQVDVTTQFLNTTVKPKRKMTIISALRG
jgi:predicted phage terminase large subunit-like protein